MNQELSNSDATAAKQRPGKPTQEVMALSSGISKEQDFLGRLQDESPLYKPA
jgi:hypothetical protein